MAYPESMLRLIEEFAKMPGVGARTAERFAFYILGAPREIGIHRRVRKNPPQKSAQAVRILFGSLRQTFVRNITRREEHRLQCVH